MQHSHAIKLEEPNTDQPRSGETILATGVKPVGCSMREGASPVGAAQLVVSSLRDCVFTAPQPTGLRPWLELWRSLRELGNRLACRRSETNVSNSFTNFSATKFFSTHARPAVPSFVL